MERKGTFKGTFAGPLKNIINSDEATLGKQYIVVVVVVEVVVVVVVVVIVVLVVVVVVV